MFSNFYQLDLRNKTRVALVDLGRNSYMQKPIESQMSVDLLTRYIGPPNCVHYSM
jgi:hypothetical protein